MASLRAPAIVCSVRPHGEHGAIVRALTEHHGLVSGYVRGAKSRTHRPILIPGNRVAAEFRARTDTQLAALTVELIASRGPQLREPLASAALYWVTSLTATVLPEDHGYPALYRALGGVCDAVTLAESARGWAAGIVRYELLLLGELGYGLALDQCVVSGAADNLAYVSPRSAAAVSASAGAPYRNGLLALPGFLIDGAAAGWEDIFAGFRLTGHFLARAFFADDPRHVWSNRDILIDRLHRVLA